MMLSITAARLSALFLATIGAAWSQQIYPPGDAIELGKLPQRWLTGGPRCMEAPDWQVHEYNQDFYILRQSGCTHYEKPFLYLIFGKDQAILLDTGAGVNDVSGIVFRTISKWLERKQQKDIRLLVAHSHAHGDHVAGDKQFLNLPNVTLVPAAVPELEKAFKMTSYPNGIGLVDLGGRQLDVIAVPGHEASAIVLYDRKTGILLTGDTFYPGRLYVTDWPAYVASAKRLVDFIDGKVVTHVLGAHIEQKWMPFSDYARGTIYQPEEHELALTHGHLLEWNGALQKAKGAPTMIAKSDYTIVPRGPMTPEQVEQSRKQYQEFEKRQQAGKWSQPGN